MAPAMTDGRCSPVVVPCPQSRSEKEEERKNPQEEFDNTTTVRHLKGQDDTKGVMIAALIGIEELAKNYAS